MPNHSSKGMSLGNHGSPPWLKLEVTVSPPRTQPMPVYYRFTQWDWGRETDHDSETATVRPVFPQKKTAY